MIEIGSWEPKALEKLKKEKAAVAGQKEKAMAGAVYSVLCDFCAQDEEFAQAIAQGGTFADCMKKVAAGTCSSISDLDAYKKAVQFYFPGAEVHMQLTIDLIGEAGHGAPEKPAAQEQRGSMTLNMLDFF